MLPELSWLSGVCWGITNALFSYALLNPSVCVALETEGLNKVVGTGSGFLALCQALP